MPPLSTSRLAPVVAALGPTNTGKTHRAIERMLEHDSGMIGLPLRLLAREVYDRISARVGQAAVALITGEERRISGTPCYWVCTVEAMPPELVVDFVAVDEVQLAAHWERGHIFCDRLLHMRGRKETWFLGADTIGPILRALVPHAEVQREHRYSQLRATGTKSLRSLPPRSAVVAFSVERVYALAERLRHLRGGAAVVLGALSPRTRNAQVALYQSGEVPYIVATDAIGMGLNLDIDHVGFADLRKFDGRQYRGLGTAEFAQIAGRAGRYRNDGTFGTITPLPPMDDQQKRDIEQHQFAPLRHLSWRNSKLDFSSVDTLLDSLTTRSSNRHLLRATDNDDLRALRALAEQPAIRSLATEPAAVEQLWEVCQVPDFEKLLVHRHVKLLGEIFTQLRQRSTIDEQWLNREVAHIDNLEGGIDTLTSRLSLVRRWTYVSHRSHWLQDARHWQERTRDIEDRLGDALHNCLVERFVERTRRSSSRKPAAAPMSGSSPFAHLEALRAAAATASTAAVAWPQRLADCAHTDLTVDSQHGILFEGKLVGRLAAGRNLHEPVVQMRLPPELGAGARRQIERRLQAFGRDLVAELLSPVRRCTAGELSQAARGLCYQLELNLGTVSRAQAATQIQLLTADDRARLSAEGIVVGRHVAYVSDTLGPRAIRSRVTLYSLAYPEVALLGALAHGPAVVVLSQAAAADAAVLDDYTALELELDERDYLSVGYLPAGELALRADSLEELTRRFAPGRRRGPGASMEELATWLAVPAPQLRASLQVLGYSAERRRRRRPARRRR